MLLNPPETWSQTGTTITVQGRTPVTPNTDAVRLRDQLLGYLNNWDEPIVPLIFTTEPRLTGYYSVLDVSVPTDQNALSVGLLSYSLTLQALTGFTQPAMESVVSGALLTNVVGAVSGDVVQFHAVPSVAVEYFRGQGGSLLTRSSADGNMLFTTSGLIGSTASFYVAPPNFYVGAATVEQGSPLQPLVGRVFTQTDLVNWRLSNGLVRITPNATAGKLDISHWKGAAWATAKTYQFTGTVTAGLINGFIAVTVLRNSVEECILRLGCTVAVGINWGRVNLDISLRRGDRIARIFLSSTAQDQWQVARSTAEAATAITYGAVTLGAFRATANDADGNRYVLASYQSAATSDLVNGKLTENATVNTMDVGIGSEIAGSAAIVPDRAVDIAQQYLAAQSESQRIVLR
jgi:hypothetical protein